MEADQERFRKQLDFILEIDKEKNILRQTHLTGHGRREDDADHSWHLAVMTWILREYSNQEIDIVRTILMVLIHDIVEIDAGDTYAYDAEAKKTEAARETRAAERIFGLLPEDQGRMLREIWEEFDAYETPEARFAHVMDNFQPMLLNDSNGGGDWKEHGVSQAQVRKRNAKTGTGSEEIWSYMQEILAENIRKGSLKP
ncbi:MAG: HD domain-containing protein [Bilifractor sp.]